MPKIYTVWNFSIFLPLWFYVKSILADFRRLKTAISTILEFLKLWFFGNFWHFLMWNIKNSKFRTAQIILPSKLLRSVCIWGTVFFPVYVWMRMIFFFFHTVLFAIFQATRIIRSPACGTTSVWRACLT